MNILFINDTTNSGHPGSIATVQGIIRMLKNTNNDINIHSLPVGYCYELLAESRGDFKEQNNITNIKRILYEAKNILFERRDVVLSEYIC